MYIYKIYTYGSLIICIFTHKLSYRHIDICFIYTYIDVHIHAYIYMHIYGINVNICAYMYI